MSATGILFSDPTKLYVVAVVVDRNHSEAKLMKKARRALAIAAIMNLGSCTKERLAPVVLHVEELI